MAKRDAVVPARPRGAGRVVRTPIDLPDDVLTATPAAGDSRARRGGSRRPVTAVCFVLVVAGMLLLGRYVGAEGGERPSPAGSAVPTRAASPAPRSTAAARRDLTDRVGSSGRFAYVPGFGPVLGVSGPVRRFRVAVEQPAPAAAGADFADQVNRTLGDRRSWVAARSFRLQRVPASAHAEFTIYLSAPRTSQRMCSTGGLETGGYTSCRLPGKVIINDARWAGAVRGYRAPVATYRQYAINHEVGHQLGHGHEACPGGGRPAPVMMQQTLGLRGCVANAWPYPGGKRYAGPPVR
jgi:hypothetical protein